MGVETATYINDFDSSLPTATDLRNQGDDHIRLVKSVLKTAFTGASRTFQIPATLSKTADYTIVKADGESTVYCSTAGGNVTFTLPTLAALDAGWKIHFVKTNSGANPMFIAPPSGTINSGGIAGLAKSRRAIPGVRITAIWDGSGFFVTRALAVPIGTTLEYNNSALPAGYEWPSGQTLASASTNYPEYNSVVGSGLTPDDRGRYAVGKDDMGGSAAGRVTTAGGAIDGATLGAVGGAQSVTLAANQIPSLTSINAAQSITVQTASSRKVPALNSVGEIGSVPVPSSGSLQAPYNSNANSNDWISLTSFTGSNSISVTYTNASLQVVKPLPPSIVKNKILVVE